MHKNVAMAYLFLTKSTTRRLPKKHCKARIARFEKNLLALVDKPWHFRIDAYWVKPFAFKHPFKLLSGGPNLIPSFKPLFFRHHLYLVLR
jgi:hypothetical protein